MDKIKILIAGAPALSEYLHKALAGEPGLSIACHANDNEVVLKILEGVEVGVALVELGSIEDRRDQLLSSIRNFKPQLPVLLLVTRQSDAALLEQPSLRSIPTLTIARPVSVETGDLDAQARRTLIQEIKRLCEKNPPTKAPLRSRRSIHQPRPAVEVVAIGSSTGGPEALAAIFPKFKRDFPVPILIAQHIPTMFTELLARRLTSISGLRAREAASGDVLEPGGVWIAPGDHHLEVRRNGTHVEAVIHQQPPVNSCRPSVDVLLRSVASTYKSGVLAVILTGMGQDGVNGCELVRFVGGQVIAQDQRTSIVWGMPGRVAKAGLADKILPLSEIADEILRRVRPVNSSSGGRS